MIRALMHALSPPASEAKLSILIFHRVHANPDPLFPGEVDARRFSSICNWVRQWCQVLPLHDACRRLRDGCLPARAMAITFDDGYADNHDVAMPILRRHGLSATFFVATGFLDGGRMWNDTLIEAVRGSRHDSVDLPRAALPGIQRMPLVSVADRRAAIDCLIRACRYLPVLEREAATLAVAGACAAPLPNTLMMRSDQVQALAAQGMTVGGHTVNHPILARLPLHGARAEMAQGKARLEELLQQRVGLFAYPNGRPGEDFAPEHAKLAEELGFEAAFTTAWGVSDSRTDRFQLPRFTPWDRAKWAFGLRLARNASQPAVAA